MIRLLKTKSLRFWVGLGMLIALLPIVLSASGGYLLLNWGVIVPFHDVTSRQRQQIIPVQKLRIMIWEALAPVDEFIEDGDPVHLSAYRSLRTQIETSFTTLSDALRGEPAVQASLERARNEWTAAERHATELISVVRGAGDAEKNATLQRYHGGVAAANDKLAAVYASIAGRIEEDHDIAVRSYERSLWLAGIAGAISLLTVVLGVIIIGRILSRSVDRLVEGAARFAEGDRTHRIEIQLPPELHRVAEEFNHMIGRIRESEAALDELAHKDSLTGLSNRRAFEESFSDIQARMQRHAETAALLAVDIDHFKRINDELGHAAGDVVLRAVAVAMKTNVRPFDKVFRTGGEEFLVLLPQAGAAKAQEIAERLRETVAALSIPFNGTIIRTSVSIGVVEIAEAAGHASVVEEADEALYQAKKSGRNRVVVGGSGRGRAIEVQ